MARPTKDSTPVERRIEDKFWVLLSKEPFGSITVSRIVAAVGCNRTTFYYYFDDIEDLAEKLIRKSLPEDLPEIAMTYLSGGAEHIKLSGELLLLIERLSLLMRQGGSAHIRQLVERAFVRLWSEKFGLAGEELSADKRYALEFLASGITGIIIRYAHPLDRDALSRSMDIINALFTEPALHYFQEG